MPDDILRTLDGLDALRNKASSRPFRWFGPIDSVLPDGAQVVASREYITELLESYQSVSSVLRRAMRVIDGIKKVNPHGDWDGKCAKGHKVGEVFDEITHCAYCQECDATKRHDYAWSSDIDRLLSENGFGKNGL